MCNLLLKLQEHWNPSKHEQPVPSRALSLRRRRTLWAAWSNDGAVAVASGLNGADNAPQTPCIPDMSSTHCCAPCTLYLCTLYPRICTVYAHTRLSQSCPLCLTCSSFPVCMHACTTKSTSYLPWCCKDSILYRHIHMARQFQVR